jgi:hypothetical protein
LEVEKEASLSKDFDGEATRPSEHDLKEKIEGTPKSWAFECNKRGLETDLVGGEVDIAR